MMGFGFGGIGMLVVILFWVVLLVGAVWIIARLFPQNTRHSPPGKDPATDLPSRSPEDILKERFARGEITSEQYEDMRHTLAG